MHGRLPTVAHILRPIRLVNAGPAGCNTAFTEGAARMGHRATAPLDGLADTATVPWLVFSDDWGRHPTSCQHVVRALLPRQPVTWVNMIGTRRPRFDLATLQRGAEKLGQWLRQAPAAESLPGN